MNASARVIDASGLPCPQPVLALKRAIEEGGVDRIEILIDNASARENVKRFAIYSGNEILSETQKSGSWVVLIGIRSDAAAARAAAVALEACGDDRDETGPVPLSEGAAEKTLRGIVGTRTVFIGSDSLGQGEPELGRLLMRGFIATLAEIDRRPVRILLMNSGVKLAAKGSEALAGLAALEKRGIEVLACGTCVEYYGLANKLAAGRLTNMFEIAGIFLDGGILTL